MLSYIKIIFPSGISCLCRRWWQWMGYLYPCKREPGIRGNSGIKFLAIRAFLYMQKSQESLGSGKAWKAKRIFSTLSSFFLCAKKPGNAKKARSSGLFLALWVFPGFFWKGPGQLVFLDSILTNICSIKFIVMRSKLVLFFSQGKN